MAEYTVVQLGKTLAYQGYFDFARLWRNVRDFVENRNYHYLEKNHNELIREEGKDIYVEVDVDRELSDYVRSRIVVRCTASSLTDVSIEQDGRTLFLNDGAVKVEFDTFIITDFEGRFADKGFLFFLRTMLEKFVYTRQLKKFQAIAQEDTDALVKEVKAYLNLFTY